jgi:putative PLP-dependent aminotransferase (TIGR04422 family)
MVAEDRAADLWPPPRLSARAWLPAPVHATTVEARLAELYPNVHPVLFSSGRAGLAALVAAMGLARADAVLLPRYSSHCVIDAVGRNATPQAAGAEGASAALLYHQWGFPHALNLPAPIRVIEDSADTLHVPGAALCSLGGEFEIISLPKILGCLSGGVVFCKQAAMAERLREARAALRSRFRLQFWLKWLGQRSASALAYWAGAECANGKLPAAGLRDILVALRRIGAVVADRQRKVALARQVAAPWLRWAPDRLPSNVPLEHDDGLTRQLEAQGLRLEARHFNAAQTNDPRQWRKVIRLPVHQGVSLRDVERTVDIARSWTKS